MSADYQQSRQAILDAAKQAAGSFAADRGHHLVGLTKLMAVFKPIKAETEWPTWDELTVGFGRVNTHDGDCYVPIGKMRLYREAYNAVRESAPVIPPHEGPARSDIFHHQA